jgi:Ca2+-binding RTX toxin-like protein
MSPSFSLSCTSSLTPEDPFDQATDSNTHQYLTTVDLEQLGALGFDTSATLATLFTTGGESVDFNDLTPSQKAAIVNRADLYHGRGGRDVVTLPDTANYYESVGSGASLNWDWTQTFYTGSLDGQAYQITGGNGTDNIQLGAGNDTVFGSPGNDWITGGAGPDKFDYKDGKYANFPDFCRARTRQLSAGTKRSRP